MIMKSTRGSALLGILLASAWIQVAYPARAQTSPMSAPDPMANGKIPFREFTLPNGLRVIVHTDHKVPVVTVNIWYHVGSKNEALGRTGFAHLFEHLMFQGSEHNRTDIITSLGDMGATNFNGTTNEDRTNYFETVPTNALDKALWIESDRMGYLLGAIDQATLDEQRGVVQNEKRISENTPMGGRVFGDFYRALFPVGHPYHWQAIGSMADLNAATLSDVKAWFKSWYGPNNSVLVLAGDIDFDEAKEKVTRYFGDIAPTATVPNLDLPLPRLAAETRETIEDAVPQPYVMRGWIAPGDSARFSDTIAMRMISNILGGGASSRLNTRLVLNDQISNNAFSSYSGMQIAGVFYIVADVKSSGDRARVERAIDEEVKRFLRDGPSEAEVKREQTTERIWIEGNLESMAQRADSLNTCAMFYGDPDCNPALLRKVMTATPESLRDVARRWLGQPSHIMIIQPGQAASARPEAVDAALARSAATIPPPDPRFKASSLVLDREKDNPALGTYPKFTMPVQQHVTLSNGIAVTLVQRPDVKMAKVLLELPTGTATDDGKRSRADFAIGMLDQGAGRYDTVGIANRQLELGLQTYTEVGVDRTSFMIGALNDKLPEGLDLLSDMLLRPTFTPTNVERFRQKKINEVRFAKATPGTTSRTLFPYLLYGEDNPLGRFNSEESLGKLTRDDLVAWQREWMRPEGTRITVVGNLSLAELVPLLESRFGMWKGNGSTPTRVPLPPTASSARPRIYLVNQPGAISSTISAGHALPQMTEMERIDFGVVNSVLGGGFASRVNLDLREDKHWTYGANSVVRQRKGAQGYWSIMTSVQTDKTGESLSEIERLVSGMADGSAPVSDAEMARIRADSRKQPGEFEMSLATIAALSENQYWNRPDNYLTETLLSRYQSLTPGEVTKVAERFLKPDSMTWLVIGDLSKIEKPIRDLNLGDVVMIDPEGKPVTSGS